MTNVLHRSLLGIPPTVVRGEGSYLIDSDGKRYLDACGGAAVSCLGHSHPDVITAIQAQLEQLPYAHSGFFTSEGMERLADELVSHAPGMGKVMLLSGGSEAVEAALKLSRQYFLETGQPERRHFIARRQSYHGNTLGALAVGGNVWRREPFRPLLIGGQHIAPCFEYRDRRVDESSADYGQRVANELESKILELGADTVAAFVAETVVGATAGAVTPVPGYFSRVRDICDQYGIHLILDEVMCGSGRTGTLMAYEQEQVVPDIVTMAKGLAAGYQPIGAMLCKESITDAIRENSGFFQHGHTFMGHTTAVAAALATLNAIKREGLLTSVVTRGKAIRKAVRENVGEHPNVGDIRGRGLFIGIEFVADRESKRPFASEAGINKLIRNTAMQNGLLCYAMGGTIDGKLGDHVLIAPPYNISDAEESRIVEIICNTINSVFAVSYPASDCGACQ